jgi:hypothetical protein
MFQKLMNKLILIIFIKQMNKKTTANKRFARLRGMCLTKGFFLSLRSVINRKLRLI